MKVFNLECDCGHRFEGWFGSLAACDTQQAQGLLQCPFCESPTVRRMPTAPHVALGLQAVPAQHAEAPAKPAVASTLTQEQIALRSKIIAMAQSLAEKADYVGKDFPEEARRMHYQEVPERPIVGEATAQEASALLEEGIAVVPLPLSATRKKDRLQ
ncbi:MAG: DUF1178 family protein [Betaproteobacteria bacterium]|nr:DUF1178 family protein [Betaproteobacteria bacterium]